MKAGNLDEAERLYELAREDDPTTASGSPAWPASTSARGTATSLLKDLAMLAANDADDLDVRRNLADMHLAREQYDEAAKWATECLYIDVYDPALHVTLGDARAGQEQYDEAIEEYQVALELEPKQPDAIKIKLAQAQHDAGMTDKAKATLDAILDADPDHPEAKALREELDVEK